jgi:Bcr/CflA subfamily drug resistance transporter
MLKRIIKAPALALLICLLGYPQISETIYTPSLPDLAHSLGIKMSAAEYTLSIYFIGFAFGVLVFGILADVLGRRKAMLIGLLIYTLASFGCGFCYSLEALLMMRFFQAFGAATGSVVTQTILRDLFSGAERSRVFAIASGALAFSPALGPIIGGGVDQLWSWRANFFILAAMGLFLGTISMVRLGETRTAPPSWSRKGFTSLLKQMGADPSLYFYALLIGGCNGVVFSYYAEAPFLFIEILGLTPAQYGLLGLVIATAFFLASYLSIQLNLRLQTGATISIGAGLSLLGSLALEMLCHFGLPSHGPTSHLGPLLWTLLMGAITLVFIGIGVMIPNCLAHALTHYQSRSGTAGSIFGFAYYWLIAGFTALMGILHDESPTAMPRYFAFITGAMLVLSAGRYLGAHFGHLGRLWSR